MLTDFQNKRILIILPKFFGYDRIIASRMEQAGAIVTMIYEDMDEVNYGYRLVNAYLPQYMPDLMNRYFLKHVMPGAEELDYVILIRGEFLNPEVLETLRKSTPSRCRYCMYQWDSVKNNHNALVISKYFDSVSTFDPDDAIQYGWKYRPLFFIPELVKQENTDIDVLYMCSLHSKRIKVLNRLKGICLKNKLKLYKRVYSKKIVYYKRKYINKREGYVSADNSDVSFVKMDVKDTYNLYNRSRIIVDYTHPGQNGFTMRTIETLGCNKKLVTNNKKVMEADFYNPDNFYVYEGEEVDIPDKFINSPYHMPDNNIYQRYSIDSWIDSIIN